jgi:ABC-type uncharacterized transport system involved in gliding motility auxiliary subunit
MRTAILALSGFAALLVGFIFRLIMPGLRYYAWGILALGVAILAVAVILDFRIVRGALVSRRGRFGVGAIVKLSLFSGIILLVNAISVGTYHRFDFTGLAQFTLTSQTKTVLEELDKPVEVVNFYSPLVPVAVPDYARNLLAEYQNYSDLLTVRDIDPDLNPDQARQYEVGQLGATYGVTVFRSEGGQRRVYGPQISVEAEHAFTSAILEVTGARQKKVYFLMGHGEGDIAAEYNSARSGLRDNLFKVDTLDLLRTPRVPNDAAVIIIAGPRKPLGDAELAILDAYLVEGGRMFVLLNPNPMEGIKQFLYDRWMTFEAGTVVDDSSHVSPSKDTPLVPRTRSQFGLTDTYFPGVTAVFAQENIPDNVELLPLVWTSPESWLETEFVSGEEPGFDGEADRKGSFAIGVTVSINGGDRADGSKETRLVVMGDSDFASNRHFRNGGNSGLFLTSVNWLAAGEDIISVDRKVLPLRQLILDPEEARFLHLSSIGLLPLLLLLAGGYMWWRRR